MRDNRAKPYLLVPLVLFTLIAAAGCSSIPVEERTAPDTMGFTTPGAYEQPTYIMFNQEFNRDPEIGRWMRTKDFRVALSLAIDRDTISEVAYLGRGRPENSIVPASSPYRPDPAALDVNRDLQRANELLDGLGLSEKDSDGFRMRLDGDGPLTLSWEISRGLGVEALRYDLQGGAYRSIANLVQKNWREIGIKLLWDEGPNTFAHMRENRQYIGMHSVPFKAEPWERAWRLIVPTTEFNPIAPEIGRFFKTGGQSGMAPSGPDPIYLPLAPPGTSPADSTGMLKRLQELWSEGLAYEAGDPRRTEIAKELFRIAAEERYVIGLVGFDQ